MGSFKLVLGERQYSKAELLCGVRPTGDNPEWINDIFDFIAEWNDSSPTIFAKTSGSTGTPKTIELRKEHMIESAKCTGTFFNFSNETIALLPISSKYIGGKMMIVRAIVYGMELHAVEPSSTPVIPKDTTYDFAPFVPTQIHEILSASDMSLDQIKTIIIGGAAISNATEKMIQQISTKCFATYGMTETVSHIALRSVNQPPLDHYKCLQGVSIDTDIEERLIINAEHLGVSELLTNDCVEQIDNQKFRILGRYDNVVNSGGVKIHVEALEQKLAKHIDRAFALTERPHAKWGEELVLVIEGDKTVAFDFTIAGLEKHEIPKDIKYTDVLPMTENGKIDRKRLKEIANLGSR